MSDHEVSIIEIKEILPHPCEEVERMELVCVMGWQCCVSKGQFAVGDKAIYIEPDYMVPTSHSSFSFLGDNEFERIRVRRFKGCLSQGLIIGVPDNLKHLPTGENVIEQLGIKRYEPPMPKSSQCNFVGAPSGLYCPVFDVENWQRWPDVFVEGEPVIVTEKMHGASARYTFAKNKEGDFEQFCGSRRNWMDKKDNNIWWQAFDQTAMIGAWCKANPEKVLYGEVFGQVQSLKYGAGRGQVFFAWFAILNGRKWLNAHESLCTPGIHYVCRVPLLYEGPFDISAIKELAEGESSWESANHMREGVVVLPAEERRDENIGRVQLKIVSNRYLEK